MFRSIICAFRRSACGGSPVEPQKGSPHPFRIPRAEGLRDGFDGLSSFLDPISRDLCTQPLDCLGRGFPRFGPESTTELTRAQVSGCCESIQWPALKGGASHSMHATWAVASSGGREYPPVFLTSYATSSRAFDSQSAARLTLGCLEDVVQRVRCERQYDRL